MLNTMKNRNRTGGGVKKTFLVILAVLAVLLAAFLFMRIFFKTIGMFDAKSLEGLQRMLEIEIKESDIMDQQELYNDYGSWLGDGLLYRQLKIHLDTSGDVWLAQPLSTEAEAFLEQISSEVDVALPQSFSWKFILRSPAEHSSRFIENASLFIYDTETGILHWISFDS